jgi:hypothetical protein
LVFDNEPSDRDGDAGDPENYGPASVSVMLRFCRCPVASKPCSTDYEDEGHFDPKLCGRHLLDKNVGVTHLKRWTRLVRANATPLLRVSSRVVRASIAEATIARQNNASAVAIVE